MCVHLSARLRPRISSPLSSGLATIVTQVIIVCMGIYLCYLVLEAQNVNDCKIVSGLGKLLVVSGFLMCFGLFGVATNPTGELRF